MIFLRRELREGASWDSSSARWYRRSLPLPSSQAPTSLQAISVSPLGMIFALLGFAHFEAFGIFRMLDRARLHLLLEQHVQEEVHRLRLDHDGARRLGGGRVEMLVDAIVVHD